MDQHSAFHRFSLRIVVGLLLELTGCEGQSQQQPSTQSTATTSAIKINSDSSHIPANQAVPSVPALPATNSSPEFFADYREVVPGLLVTTSGVPVSDDTTTTPRRILTIRRNGHVIYTDTTADYLYRNPDDPEMELYPLWVPTGPGRGELLVRVATPPDLDFLRRFVVNGQHVVCRDTLPAFDERPRNLDQDPALELIGGRYSSEGLGNDGHGHTYVAYSPLLCYEVRSTGLVLDTALTIRRNRARYGKFYGFRYLERQVMLRDTADNKE